MTAKTFIIVFFLFVQLLAQEENKEYKDFSNSINTFALDIYKEIASTKNENLVMSPFSISSALSMLHLGAKSQTASEIEKLLNINDDPKIYHRIFGNVMDELLFFSTMESPFQLYIANCLWIERSFELKNEFIEKIQNIYKSEITKLDIMNDPRLSANEINKWVSEKTKGNIKQIIDPGSISPKDEKAILTDAIYFKGVWKYKFNESKTKEDIFYLLNGNEIDVDFMNNFGKFDYFENEDVQVLELKYKGDDISMIFILPKGMDNFYNIENKLNINSLNNYLTNSKQYNVEMYIPKFTFSSEINLKNILKNMGLHHSFDEHSANFSNMYLAKRNEILYIDNVLHKAYIEVNEKGTEAAAVTAIRMKTKFTSNETKILKKIFRADHPFLYFIRDIPTNTILFMGRIINPKTG